MSKINHISGWKIQIGLALFIVLAFNTYEVHAQPKSTAQQTQDVQLSKTIKGE